MYHPMLRSAGPVCHDIFARVFSKPMLTDSLHKLFLNEPKELNEWNRAVAQIFFAWYTVFLALDDPRGI